MEIKNKGSRGMPDGKMVDKNIKVGKMPVTKDLKFTGKSFRSWVTGK